MKLLILVLAIAAIAHSEYTDDQEEKWQSFKLEHGKLFLSPGKEKDRKDTFLKNAADVEAHNEAFLNGETTFSKAIHAYSDLPKEQFLKRFAGVKMPANTRRASPVYTPSSRAAPPTSLDLRTHGGTGAVRDQNPCGSCWAFSATASLEYAYWRKTGIITDLSEQHLVDCTYGAAGGCEGGWMPTAFEYLANNGGQICEKLYPYTAISGKCQAPVISVKQVLVKKPTSWVQIADDDTAIKTALNEMGTLAVCVDADDWDSYSGGIFTNKDPSHPECQHAVNLVGYGTTNGIPYWIIRNSWNTWWGESGYMRADARRGADRKNLGGVMTDLVYFPYVM